MTIRLLRALDAILYSLIACGFLACYEMAATVNVRGQPTIFIIVPVAGVCLAALMLPLAGSWPEGLKTTVLQLKTAALVLLGLAPFFPWHAHGTVSVYLTAGAALAFAAAVVYAILLMAVADAFFSRSGETRLRRAAYWLRLTLSYAVLTPGLTVYAFVIGHMLREPASPVRLMHYTWQGLHGAIQLAIGIVVFGCYIALLLLTWRMRISACNISVQIEE